jgi:hypothetical protein
MSGKRSFAWLLAALFLVGPGIALSQDAAQSGTLVITGRTGHVPVIQVNGRSYVDLESLARTVNGSLSFGGSQITLTLPGARTAAPAQAPVQQPNRGFSPGFLRAGIEAMATVREWHSALATAIQNQIPITASWLGAYRAQAATSLNLAQAAISTSSDRNAYPLLNNEFQNMGMLTDKYVAKRANVEYISPDSLQNDDLNQTIVNCGHSLAAMSASGQFVDDGSCH